MEHQDIGELLTRQDGLLTRSQAIDCGMTPRQIDTRLSRGDWSRVLPLVYRHHACPLTSRAEARAGSLWLGAAPLVGPGAGWWWGLVPDPPEHWEYAVAPDGSVSRRSHYRARRCFVDPDDLTVHDGQPVLSRPLAALRTAERLEIRRRGRGAKLLDRLLQREVISTDELESAFRRNRGTWGTRTMRTLLGRTRGDAHSELERIGDELLRAAGITGYQLNFATRLGNGRPVEIDIAFADRKIAIELDGFAFHASPDAHRDDVHRMNDLLADGWTVRRFTYWDLVDDPARFVRIVRGLLAGSLS